MPNSPIKRLTLVDIGPLLAAGEMKQMAAYIAKPPAFKTMPEFEKFVRDFRAPAWEQHRTVLAGIRAAECPRPARRTSRSPTTPASPPPRRERQRASISGRHGRHHLPGSDLSWREISILPQASPTKMTRRGRAAALENIKGCGHVPSLAAPEQIALVREWLLPPV